MERRMNPIVKLAASAVPGEKKYVLLAGAGVSKDAGIPTAWDLMLSTASLLYVAENKETNPKSSRNQIEEWFLKSEYANKEYAELMDLLYPNYPDQQDFLKKHLKGHKLGDSHRGIAELARRGIIRAIITTNFDHYIEKALEGAYPKTNTRNNI
jgi:NAD-dependent SIR2 family protein deacetylase